MKDVNIAAIEEHIRLLKEECANELHNAGSSPEEAYLRSAVNVLEGLEKSFERFCQDQKHTFSKKSQEPWD